MNQTVLLTDSQIASGAYIEAGVAAHRLGDLFAHVTPDGTSYESVRGHAGDGHAPDLMFFDRHDGRGSVRVNQSRVLGAQRTVAEAVSEGLIRRGITRSGATRAQGVRQASHLFRSFYDRASDSVGFRDMIHNADPGIMSRGRLNETSARQGEGGYSEMVRSIARRLNH